MKRDDLFCVGGVRGGKVRGCWAIATAAGKPAGLVTASHRPSPQSQIVAAVARKLGVPCRVHAPFGPFTDEMKFAAALGAEFTQHDCGYNNVIIRRAKDDAARLGWLEIPFGMEHERAVDGTAEQVRNLPDVARRLVIAVGSGISLAGVLRGMKKYRIDLAVLGVMSGADSRKRLDKYAPPDWRDTVELVPSGADYHTRVSATLGGVLLDPIYEAKCVKFLRPGDVLWCVGIRRTPPPPPEIGDEECPPPPRRPSGSSG